MWTEASLSLLVLRPSSSFQECQCSIRRSNNNKTNYSKRNHFLSDKKERKQFQITMGFFSVVHSYNSDDKCQTAAREDDNEDSLVLGKGWYEDRNWFVMIENHKIYELKIPIFSLLMASIYDPFASQWTKLPKKLLSLPSSWKNYEMNDGIYFKCVSRADDKLLPPQRQCVVW